jgi:hypothetical protein
MQAALYLTVTRGFAAPEARMCYERVESLCHSLNRPLLLYSALISQWRYSLWTDKLKATMQIAGRVYSLAQEQKDARLMMGAYRVLASTLYFLGDFENSGQYACVVLRSGVQEPYSVRLKRSALRPSIVCALRPSPSGISERSPLAVRPWRKPSH